MSLMPVFSNTISAYRFDSLSAVQTDALNGVAVAGFQFTNAGSVLRWSDRGGNFSDSCRVYSATLSTPWDVSTAGSTTTTEFTVDINNNTRGGFSGIEYRDDGATLIAAEYTAGDELTVYEFSVSPAYTGTETEQATLVETTEDDHGQFVFSDSGTKLHVPGGPKVFVSSLSIAYDISSAGAFSVEKDFSTDITGSEISAVCFARSENTLLLADSDNKLYEFSLSVLGDFSSSTLQGTVTWSPPSPSGVHGIRFGDNGRKFYVTGSFGIQEYDAVA